MKIVVALLCVCVTSAAMAASPHVYVSGFGLDIGTCPRVVPCRTFAYAITQVSPNGEIVALDSATYGSVTIPFSLTLYAVPGATAQITTAGNVSGITVSAGVNDAVIIRGLLLSSSLTSTGLGQIGIFFNSGRSLKIYDSTFTYLGTTGGSVTAFRTTTDTASLYIDNCKFLDQRQGITAEAPNGKLLLAISNSRFQTIGSAIVIGSNVHAEIHDTDVFDTARAVLTSPTVGTADANLERCTLSHNGEAFFAISLGSNPDDSIIRVSNCTVTDNDTAVFTNVGRVLSRLNNTLEDNPFGNAFTGTYAAK